MVDCKKSLGFITFAYGIGAILVVFGHSYPIGESEVPSFLLDLRSFIYIFHMPLFFFIAGVLMKYTNDIENVSCKGQMSFVAKKAGKLLTPYFVLAFIAVMPKYFVAQYVTRAVSFDITYFIRIFLIPRENVWGHFWFIPVLFAMLCFRNTLLYSYSKIWVATLLTAILITIHFYPINTGWLGIRDVCFYGLYFWLGVIVSDCVIAQYAQLFSLKKGLMAMFAASMLFIGLFYFMKGTMLIKGILSLLTALLMIYAIFVFGTEYQRREYVFLDWLNGKVFTVFLLSWPCQAVIQIWLNKILKLNWYYVMPSMFFAGLFGPLFVIYIYEKFHIRSRFLKVVLGIK